MNINIAHDLSAFINYVQSYDIKRSHRENEIPKTDLKRLEKILNIPGDLSETEEGRFLWIDWISHFALYMNLVSFSTKGVYASFHSQEPTFPDNYIEISAPYCKEYLNLSPAEKEFKILEAFLLNTSNEFYCPGLLGTQWRFSLWGRSMGASVRMDLPLIRKKLLEILATFPIDVPVPFHSFLEHVQTKVPDLILKKTDSKVSKYCTFHENIYPQKVKFTDRWVDGTLQKEISDADPDAFERVEGRYLAYFLEAIAYPMSFVTLEYDIEFIEGLHDRSPILPKFIKSFTLTKKFHAMQCRDLAYLNRVKTTVTPDFKVFIEATLYPYKPLTQLEPYTQILVKDTYMTTLELSRKKTVQSLADSPSLQSPLTTLKELDVNVPKNVEIDILEWTSQADKFIVYEGFGVLEIDKTAKELSTRILQDYKQYIAEDKIPNFFLISNENEFYQLLENVGLVPEKFTHPKKQINIEKIKCAPRIGKGAKSKIVEKKSNQIEKVTIEESMFVALKAENPLFIKKMKKAFEEVGVTPIQPNEKVGVCFIPDKARSKLAPIIKKLSREFQIELL